MVEKLNLYGCMKVFLNFVGQPQLKRDRKKAMHFSLNHNRNLSLQPGLSSTICSDLGGQIFSPIRKQAGAELGQAQLKLGLDFTLIFFTFSRFGLIDLVLLV